MTTLSWVISGWFGFSFLILCFFVIQDWWWTHTGRPLDEEFDSWALIWEDRYQLPAFDPERHA